MKKILSGLFVLIILVFVSGCSASSEISNGFAGKQVAAKFEKEITINVKSQYLIYFPEDYNRIDKTWPLVMFLHGAGERGTDIELVKKNGPPKLVSEEKKFPFILLSPQCPEKSWWNNRVLFALLNEVISKYKIDENRIYLTGLSMGGYATWSLAIEYPEKFAAIVPICGGGEPNDVCALKNVPVWVFHGEKDNVVPIKEDINMVEALKQCGGNVKFTRYPETGHDAWTETYNNPELYNWLLENKNEN